MDLHHHQRLQPELDPGERVLWSEAPDPLTLLVQQRGYRLAFLLCWTLFAVIAASTLLLHQGDAFPQQQSSLVFVMLAVPVVFVGVGLVSLVRESLEARNAWTTLYAVTDRRGIILAGRGGVTSIHVSEMGNLTRKGSAGRESLLFTVGRWDHGGRGSAWIPGKGFVGIKDARKVERLLRQQLIDRNPD
ncbi:hypothetical protein [Maricaulis sp. MIT060901]|uniref:hypothetical protein n=1 Tax=Maricaulis sp. MIT060901 TaxID=3096993 RepID=UPI00399C36E9